MILMSEAPIFDEWLALFEQDRARAERLIESLRAELQEFPLFSGAHVQISVEDYERARQWYIDVTTDPTKQAQLRQRVALGRAMMAPPPDADQWRMLWNTDSIFARKLQGAFLMKSAALGLATPRAILESLAAYKEVVGHR